MDLPSSGRTPLDHIAVAIHELLPTDEPRPLYARGLDAALWEQPPPFGTELYARLYREASSSALWLLQSVLRTLEGVQGKVDDLLSVSRRGRDEDEQRRFHAHAVTQARSGFERLCTLDRAFPGAIDPELRTSLETLVPTVPPWSPDREPSAVSAPANLKELLGLNLWAIHARFGDRCRRDAIMGFAEPDQRPAIEALLDGIDRGLADLVTDTAAAIESRASELEPRALASRFADCMDSFNRSTIEDPIEYAYSLRFGIYP